MIAKLQKWIKENKFEFILLLGTLILGAFFRLFKIDQYMTFLGDEGRDVIIVRRLLVNFDPILIGPGTSIGNMYLGPLYYYLMAPALFLANFSPVGPAVQIALLGVVTIWFVWFVSREWFGKIAAIIAAFLYTISPVVINYSKSSWNPNIMPFFALLSIYVIWKIWKNSFKNTAEKKSKNERWLIVLGISCAFILQSHYLGLLIFPTIGFFWLLTFVNLSRSENSDLKVKRNFIKFSFYALIVFLLLMSPLVIFDARHGWQNFNAIKIFFTERQTTVSVKPWSSIPKMFPIWKDDLVTRIMGGFDKNVGLWIAFGILDLTVLYLIKHIKDIKETLLNEKTHIYFVAPFLLVSVWLLSGILGLGLYKQHIYDHYFGFLFPAPFILFGAYFEKIWNKNLVLNIFLILSVILITYLNLNSSPLRYPPNRQMQRAIAVAEKIKMESNNEKLNLAVIAKQNYEDGYQYFLEKSYLPVYDIDPLKLSETIAQQLFVVCELPKEECDPTHSPKAEIANFGWSKIAGVWEVSGVTVYKLVHTQ